MKLLGVEKGHVPHSWRRHCWMITVRTNVRYNITLTEITSPSGYKIIFSSAAAAVNKRQELSLRDARESTTANNERKARATTTSTVSQQTLWN